MNCPKTVVSVAHLPPVHRQVWLTAAVDWRRLTELLGWCFAAWAPGWRTAAWVEVAEWPLGAVKQSLVFC